MILYFILLYLLLILCFEPSTFEDFLNVNGVVLKIHVKQTNKQTPWSESASELYRPSDRRLSAKLVPTFANRRCHVVSVTDPYGRILGFLDPSGYFSFT
jgi:hypothetical protein